MPLPWVRLDSSIASHDKVLNLLADPSPKRWQAAFSYVCSLGWSGNHGTDGYIPLTALPYIHANKGTADLLVKYLLWQPVTAGWQIPNYASRQQLADEVFTVRKAKVNAGQRGNHIRWHVNQGISDPKCPLCQESQK
jgi:hypothetical protein